MSEYDMILAYIEKAHYAASSCQPQTSAPSRALAVARTKLDEARMWVNEAIELEGK